MAAVVARILTSGTATDLRPLIAEHYAPDFLAMVPVDRHLEVLGRMQTELEGFRVTAFAAEDADAVRLTLAGPAGIKHLRIGVAPGDAPKVAGLGVEDQ